MRNYFVLFLIVIDLPCFAVFNVNLGYQRMHNFSEDLNKISYGADFQSSPSSFELFFKGNGEYGKYSKNGKDIKIENYLFIGDVDFFLVQDSFSVLTYHSYKMDILSKTLIECNNGAGVKYYLYRDNKSNYLSFSLMGLLWRKEYLDRDARDSFRLSFRPKFAISLNEYSVFKIALFYKPKIDEFKDYILEGEASLDLQLRPNLFLTPSYKITYYKVDHQYEESGSLSLKLSY